MDYGPRMGRKRGMASGGGGGDITVHVELLARALMRKQEGAAAEQQHRVAASSHRLSRVPVHLRDNNANDYTPGFVAIGPLHNREERRLRPAERLKVAYLNGLISRGHPDPAHHLVVIQEYVRIVAAREQEARAMYVSEELTDIPADDFIQMMVLDGCFILEHLINVATGWDEPSLYATPFGPAQLSVDLILAENQIPFFVLVDIIAASRLPEFETTGYPPPVLLVKLMLFYLAGEKGRDISEALPDADGVSHIMHLLHEMITGARTRWASPPESVVTGLAERVVEVLCHLPSLFAAPLLRRILPVGPRRRARSESDYVPSASDLKRMGVRFKKACGLPRSKPVIGIASVLGPVPLAVTLEEKQLELPGLGLEFRTAPLLLNLMAFEQSSYDSYVASQDVSAYVAFMGKLVGSAEDARVLAEAEVLQQLGNESMEEVAKFFRRVGAASEATATHGVSYLFVTLDGLRSRLDTWFDVERNYFTFLAELLAVVTFVSGVATIFQTYAAFKYH